MLTATLDGLVERFSLEGERLGEVVAGAVLKHARDRDLTRESVLGSKLAPETPAYDVQQACGTGLETDDRGRQQDRARADRRRDRGRRRHRLRRADRRQRGPAPDPARPQPREVAARRGRGTLTRLRPGQVVPEIPRNAEPRTGLSMGEHAALMARDWGVTREEQDELAVASHQQHGRGLRARLLRRPRHARTSGWSATRTCAPDSSVEKLAKLKPVFGGEDGTMTAGNSTPLTDGASAVLLASEEWAARARPAGAGVLRRRADRGRRPRAQGRGAADGARLRDAAAARPQRARASATSTCTRSTRRSPRRCWRRSPPGATRCSARERLGRDDAAGRDRPRPSSTSTAARWPPGIRSPPPAGGSWPRWPRRSTSAAAGAA